MGEMVDRVAKALKIAGMSDRENQMWFAVKAIEAMREPTEGMVIAGSNTDMGLNPEDVTLGWQAMIDAALKP